VISSFTFAERYSFVLEKKYTLAGWKAVVGRAADRALAHPRSTAQLVQAARPASFLEM